MLYRLEVCSNSPACSLMALTNRGCEWPTLVTATPATASRYSLGLVPQAGAQALGKTQGQGLVGAHQVGGGHRSVLQQGSVFLQYR